MGVQRTSVEFYEWNIHTLEILKGKEVPYVPGIHHRNISNDFIIIKTRTIFRGEQKIFFAMTLYEYLPRSELRGEVTLLADHRRTGQKSRSRSLKLEAHFRCHDEHYRHTVLFAVLHVFAKLLESLLYFLFYFIFYNSISCHSSLCISDSSY